jgi:flagellar basal body-associated protein FliL
MDGLDPGIPKEDPTMQQGASKRWIIIVAAGVVAVIAAIIIIKRFRAKKPR